MNPEHESNLRYFYQLVERARGNARRMAVAIGITTVGLIAMLVSKPWRAPVSMRQITAYLLIFVVSVGAVWFASRMLRENRLLEAEARELAEELDLEP